MTDQAYEAPILRLPVSAEPRLMLRRVGHEWICNHKSGFDVDWQRRVVRCRKCNAEVNPFDAIAELSSRWMVWSGERDALMLQIERLQDRVESLKREEACLVASLHRADEQLRSPRFNRLQEHAANIGVST